MSVGNQFSDDSICNPDGTLKEEFAKPIREAGIKLALAVDEEGRRLIDQQ
jgi:hypothetical protein